MDPGIHARCRPRAIRDAGSIPCLGIEPRQRLQALARADGESLGLAPGWRSVGLRGPRDVGSITHLCVEQHQNAPRNSAIFRSFPKFSAADRVRSFMVASYTSDHPRPTALRWPFLFGGRREPAGVHEGSCGLRGGVYVARPGGVSLSPGGSSLLIARVPAGEVRKRPHFCSRHDFLIATPARAAGSAPRATPGGWRRRRHRWTRVRAKDCHLCVPHRSPEPGQGHPNDLFPPPRRPPNHRPARPTK